MTAPASGETTKTVTPGCIAELSYIIFSCFLQMDSSRETKVEAFSYAVSYSCFELRADGVPLSFFAFRSLEVLGTNSLNLTHESFSSSLVIPCLKLNSAILIL